MKKPGLIVSYTPHIHCGSAINTVMYEFILALMPALLYGIYLFGIDAARVISLSALTCLVSEYFLQKLFKKPLTVTDGSALLTGLLLGAILPSEAPYWLIIVAGFMSMLVGKHVFGGLGSHPFNAALVGWAIVKISWKPFMDMNLVFADGTLVYPLGLLQKAGAAGLAQVSYLDMFIGREIGGAGSTSALYLGIGGLYLISRGLISWRIPVMFLIGIIVTSLGFFLADTSAFARPCFHLFTGGTMIGAFFLTTDYSSSPVNKTGMLLFGFGCGFFTIMFRILSVYPDGTFFAILIMNMLTPFLDLIGTKKPVKGVSAP